MAVVLAPPIGSVVWYPARAALDMAPHLEIMGASLKGMMGSSSFKRR